MLGRLAKNLRFFGFDTLYVGELEKGRDGKKPLEDKEILEIAIETGRLVLTKDDLFADRNPPGHVILVKGKNVREYFTFLKERLGLSLNFNQANSRCYKDNIILEKVPKSSVKDRVKEKTFAAIEDFWECPICKKLYWKGSHFDLNYGLLAKFEGICEDS
jgi:uncharacterized protein